MVGKSRAILVVCIDLCDLLFLVPASNLFDFFAVPACSAAGQGSCAGFIIYTGVLRGVRVVKIDVLESMSEVRT